MNRLITGLLIFASSLTFTGSLRGQAPDAGIPMSFNDWFESRVRVSAAKSDASHQLGLVIANGKGVDKQTTTTSVDSRSASLVDQSSAPDLLSAAINAVPASSTLGGGTGGMTPAASSSGSSGSGAVTATLYALIASVHGTGITDPTFYEAHPHARQLSFTVGSAASSQALDNTTSAATTLGVKYLAYDSREIFSKRNEAGRQAVQDQSGQLGIVRARAVLQARLLAYQLLCPGKVHPETLSECQIVESTFTTDTLPKLPDVFTSKVDKLIATGLAPAEVQFQAAIQMLYDQISQAPQIAFSYSTDLRSGVGYDHHRGELIADFASSKSLSWTVNASSEFINKKGTAANSNGGRFALEAQYQIERPSATSTRSALTISFSGEGDWLTKQKPQYTGQVKTEIPITGGISIPIAYTYQNRAARLDKTNSEAKLGLSIDFAKVIQGLKSTK